MSPAGVHPSRYRIWLDQYLRPTLGDLPVVGITPTVVLRWHELAHHLHPPRDRLRQRGIPRTGGQFHATLVPRSRHGRGLTLTSRAHDGQTGHHLSHVDTTVDELTVLAVHGFEEQLDVFVKDGTLRAEHAFWLFGFPFLTLHYRIARKPAP